MTDLEKRNEKAEALLSFEEALDTAAAQRAKINRFRLNLGAICDWLERLENAGTSRELIRTDFYSKTLAGHINVLANATFRDAMDYDAVVIGLHQQIVGALGRVEETTRKKEALGLR